MTFNFIRNVLKEGKAHILEIEKLPYDSNELNPSISKSTIDYHYEKLAKTYAERYNAGEGDPSFNEAGVFLHNILFQQYHEYNSQNKPTGKSLEFIESRFTTFDKFKEEFLKIAMTVQGSGWVYLSKSGEIKTIKNHEIKKDILVLVDWWEHAWALDYQSDKKKYLENQWKIINWEKINGLLRQGY
jgi:Fe-Mn family superoxide dismutase